MKTLPKNAIWITLIAVGHLTLITGLAASQELGERYEDKERGFSMRAPFGWIIEPVESDGGRSFFAPADKDGKRANVNVVKASHHAEFGAYVTSAMATTARDTKKMGFDELSVVSRTDFKTISKIRYTRVISTAKIQGYLLRFDQYYFAGKGDDKFVITFTASDKDKTTNDKIFDLSAATFLISK